MFGADHPIILAPMSGVGTPELAAAVCNAGGIGSLAAAYLTPGQIKDQIDRLRAMTGGIFAVNIFIHDAAPLKQDAGPVLSLLSKYHREMGIEPPAVPAVPAEKYAEQLKVILAAKVPILSFTFGIPDQEILAAFRASGTKLIGTATTVAEARALQKSGVDAVVAQGAQAGAHRGTFLGSFEDAMIPTTELVSQMVGAISLPVIAAGGIRQGQEVKAMLGIGAAAAQIGTAFIPCPESGAPEVYKQAVLAGIKAGDTVVTRAFSGRPARGLPNRLIREMDQLGQGVLDFPWQNATTRPLRNAAAKAGRAEFLALWAGEGTGALRRLAAGELVRRILEEAR